MAGAKRRERNGRGLKVKGRDAGAGGGAVGATSPPPTCKLWERCPQTLDYRCRSFLFLFVIARKLGSLPNIVGQIREVFSFG